MTIKHEGLAFLFNGISTFVDYSIPKQSPLKKNNSCGTHSRGNEGFLTFCMHFSRPGKPIEYADCISVEEKDPIYQPLRSGRIWHKVKFLSGV